MLPRIPEVGQLADLLAEYLDRYPNADTRYNLSRTLYTMFNRTGRTHPAQLTEGDLIRWMTEPGRAGRPPANNTVRHRMATAVTFLSWCHRKGFIPTDPTVEFGRLVKQYPKTYGKRQDTHPARFLTYDQAFGQLIEACRDRTWHGSRDQLAIRFGLLGFRASEVIGFTVGNLTPELRLHWIGKGRKARDATPGAVLQQLLARWLAHYERQIGRPLRPSDPVLCRTATGRPYDTHGREIMWGEPMSRAAYRRTVAYRAEVAGLGHVAPHDLRRTAAAILHNARTPDGGHLFDLLDIQQMLDHADPATTQRSYLAQIDNRTKDSAARVLD